MNEKPLVTFALFAYNQEKFIREAVEGALAQTYSPLQIILSDDCSPDDTFEIMEEMAKKYSGPHEIILNRNKKNLGLVGHINAATKLANGEFIVVAAGDDISLPERTSKLLAFYLNSNRPAVVFSDCEEIDNDGNLWPGTPTGQIEQTISEFFRNPITRGATHAWCKEIITKFQDVNESVTNEDMVMTARAYMLGRPPKMLREKLIKYRRDAQRSKGSADLAVKFFWQIWPYYSATRQYLEDIKQIDSIDDELNNVVTFSAKKEKLKIDLIRAKSIIDTGEKAWNILTRFGINELVKIWVIRCGKLTQREKELLRLDSLL